MQRLIVSGGCLALALMGCASAGVELQRPESSNIQPPNLESEPSAIASSPSPKTPTQSTPTDAAVTAVSTSGEPDSYQFSVTIRSQETGCDAYANWWEIVTPAGELLYRRVLFHSHVTEQPFTRSGGPVPLAMDEVAIIRVHFDPSGYSPSAMQGTVADGFNPIELAEDFAADLAQVPPLPQGCNF